MKLIIISILLIFNNHLAGQHNLEFTGNDPCSGKIYIKSDQSYRKYPFEKYSDFISYYFRDTSQTQHLTPDKDDISEIKIVGCYPNLILFEDVVNQNDSLALEILLDTTTIYLDTSMILSKYISNDNNLRYYISENYYGYAVVANEKAHVSKIASIDLIWNRKRVRVDSSVFNNLINPNTCNHMFEIQPVKAYHNPKMNVVYIYVIGFIPAYLDGKSVMRDDESFFSKIVIDPVSGNSFAMTTPGWILRYYGWADCPGFWPY